MFQSISIDAARNNESVRVFLVKRFLFGAIITFVTQTIVREVRYRGREYTDF